MEYLDIVQNDNVKEGICVDRVCKYRLKCELTLLSRR